VLWLQVLGGDDAAWYSSLFFNGAARVVEAQRRLTSYTDPFLGYIILNGSAHVVRQRSPWKTSINLDALTTYADFAQLVQQIAVITATSHARGTVGHSPGQFKEVVAAALGSPYATATWGISVARLAATYHEQVRFGEVL
jgi:hypothetical protein